FHPLGLPRAFGLLLDRVDVALQFGALVAGGSKLFLYRGFLSAQFLDDRRFAAAHRRDLRAQFACGALGVFVRLPELIVFVFAFGEDLALRRQPRFEVVDAVAEHFGFLDLDDQLPVEIGDALAQIFDAAARFAQFVRRALGIGALLGEASLRRRKFLFGVADAALQLFDLRAHRDQLDLAAVRRHRTIIQFLIDPGELGLLVGQRLFGVAQQFGLGREFLFGGAQLLLHRLLARLERKDRGVLFAELDLHAVDRVALLAEFGELAGGLVLELLDVHFEPSRRHSEFRAELILVGLDLCHRQGGCGLWPA